MNVYIKLVYLFAILLHFLPLQASNLEAKTDSLVSESLMQTSTTGIIEESIEHTDSYPAISILGRFIIMLIIAVLLILLINTYIKKNRQAIFLQKKDELLKQAKEDILKLSAETKRLNSEVKYLYKKQIELDHKSSIGIALLSKIWKKNVLLPSILTGDKRADILMHLAIQNIVVCQLLEDDAYSLNIEMLILEDVANQILTHISPLFKEVQIELDLDKKKDYRIHTDLSLLQLVILNLIINAIEKSDTKDAIQIKIERNESGEFSLSVIDYGKGIPKKHQKSIFQKYFTLGRQGAVAQESAGLGLYICSRAMSLLKGEIKLESKVGVGSKFSVIFS